MKIAISGASGLIGSHLAQALSGEGHRVIRLVRRPPPQHARTGRAGDPGARADNEIAWDGETPPGVSGCDAVVHLAGETIMGRWTAAKKTRILESRRKGTRSIAAAVAAAPRPPVLVTASAVAYYGSRGDELLTEDSPPGSDFLAQVAAQWEQEAAEAARQAGARVVALRFGMVLTPAGGALKQMLLPFRLGLGGRIGSGAQWISWVALEDVVGAISFALATPSLSGAVNVVAPQPVTNAEFTRALGAALHRPTIFPLPAGAVKLVLGEMGQALLLASQRVVPARLQASGYRFRHTDLEQALRTMLR